MPAALASRRHVSVPEMPLPLLGAHTDSPTLRVKPGTVPQQ